MKKIIFQLRFLLFCIYATGIVACSSGTSQSNNANGIGDSSGNDSNYTLVIYYPGNNANTYYNDLLTNLNSGQSNVPVDRILLSTQNPYLNPSLFAIGSNIANSGLAVQFLAKLAQSNPNVQVYAYPDVEISSGWENWTPPVVTPEPASCVAAVNSANSVEQQDVLKSICWASLVNQLIASSTSTQESAISGVAYDGQSFILKDSDLNRAWIYNQTTNDGLLLGWLSSGMKINVNLNLIEVYDLDKGSTDAPRIDTVVPDSVYTLTESYLVAKTGNPNVGGLVPVYNNGLNTYNGAFPGLQWILATNLGTKLESGEVGANIYQCALANTTTLSQLGCNNYSNNIDITQTPDNQMLQSLNYIFNNVQKTPLTISSSGPIYGAESPAIPGNSIVYLFSTQYIGPVNSYAGSGLQCSESAGNCSCIASLYNPAATCGDENGFGSWGNNWSDFNKFSQQFLVSQETPQNQCPAPGGCAAGIYMYDFIPQKWYER